ncbi:hypothetical protein OnM2_002027 [Erysiphe neolycopersici]|uniref:Uncharacterized protein n=1 Tax=Erysiphe neolycopersici TaxID=212602 RepID=A0A420I853_9PEZI|nr:hypothetical protein OnM2_002027 [Erysiphe neolycopersici]
MTTSGNLNEALAASFELDEKKERRDADQSGLKNRSPPRARSLSDIGLPSLSPSSSSKEFEKRTWRDDSSIDRSFNTPENSNHLLHGLTLKMPPREFKQPTEFIPVSPNLEKYTTNMLPRHSRGMDFSRAATNLHHSTLADKSSADSSPIAAGRAISIQCKTNSHNLGSYGDFHNNMSSLWPMSSSIDQMNLSSSLGSVNMMIMGSDSSESCSDDDDLMDDIDDSILTTPLSRHFGDLNQDTLGDNWLGNSISNYSPINFQKSKRRPKKKKNLNCEGLNTTLGLITKPIANNNSTQEPETPVDAIYKRRKSSSWIANQLCVSGNENDEKAPKNMFENIDSPPITPSRDGQRGVIRRPVTRRGNMLPKTKGFARIQVALAEESAPIETEVLREAAVVRQTRESDIEYEHRQPFGITQHPQILALRTQKSEKSPEKDENKSLLNTHSEFKEKLLLKSKSKGLWATSGDDTLFSMNSPRTPASVVGSDIVLDFPLNSNMPPFSNDSASPQTSLISRPATPQPGGGLVAVDITQKLSKKRLRDDDFDLFSIKRRAVSPGMSVHNSPIIKSPMQRDHTAWGSRPASSCNIGETGKSPINTIQKRVGLQGMMDTNDSLMKMSIE